MQDTASGSTGPNSTHGCRPPPLRNGVSPRNNTLLADGAGNEFRGWIDEPYQSLIEDHTSTEDVSVRRTTEFLSAETILETVSELLGVEAGAFRECRRSSPLRAIAVTMLIRFGERPNGRRPGACRWAMAER